MPSVQLAADFHDAMRQHEFALADLVPVLRRMAIETMANVLPGASVIETLGEFNEDWVPALRIQHVLGAGEELLFDVDTGHSDRAVEDVVDTVNIEYLDVLIDLTGDDYMGLATIG